MENDFFKSIEEDVRILNAIAKRYDQLIDTDPAGAFKLMKVSLSAFYRWNEIRCEFRKQYGRGQGAETKDKLEGICKYLNEVHIDARIIWSRAENQLKNR